MRLCALISMACVLTAFGSVQPDPGFDPKEVVRQIRARADVAGSRPGDSDCFPSRQGDRVPSHPTAAGRGRAADGGGLFTDEGEFLLDTNSTLVPAPGQQKDPAVAFDGENYLVVWEDLRSGGFSDIYGARVTPDGTMLDATGFVISQAADDQESPVLAFDGQNYLVVWQDYRSVWESDVYGARVTPGGTVLDPSGFAIAQVVNSDQTLPALGFDGANFLVAWQDERNGPGESDIFGARVTQQGAVLDPLGFVITQAANEQYDPCVGFGGTNYLVAWQDRRDTLYGHIYGNLVTPQGEVVIPGDVVISYSQSSQGYPALGFNGEIFFVAWQDIQGSFPPTLSLHGARVTPGATVLDPDGIVISTSAGTRPAVDSDGKNFLVAWEVSSGGNFSINGARVTPEGSVLDPQGIGIARGAGARGSSAVGFDGANFLVAWHDYRNNPAMADVYGARVTPDGAVLDSSGFVIPRAARDQLTPTLGFDGATFLVVWEDHRSGYSDIYGARVTSGGTVLDPDGIAISQAPGWQYSPALGFDGANYFVVWEDQRSGYSDIYGARVAPGGAVLDPDGFAVSQAADGQYGPALAFDGANFLVAWEDGRGGHSDIYGARVTPAGTVLDPPGIAITQAAGDQWQPSLGYDGANFLVAWQDYRNGEYSDIYGGRVTPGGVVLDAQGFAISKAVLDQGAPVMAFGGTNFLMVWTDYRSGIYSDIFGARVTPQGKVVDSLGLRILRAAYSQVGPALGIGFDGTNFLVVWEDYRSNHPDIYGALVTTDGVVFDSGPVVSQEGNQLRPALARGTGSQMFLVYQGWAGTIGGKTYNTDRIWGTFDPFPGSIEETPSADVRTSNRGATVVRGVLYLPRALDPSIPSALLDISGREVLALRPGANDVSSLAPGVYFVHQASSAKRDASSVMKVVVQR